MEWGTDYDIRVNGIAPGPIQGTPGLRKLAPEEMSKGNREMIPLFKFGEKRDIAMVSLYLASDAGWFYSVCFLISDVHRLPKGHTEELFHTANRFN